MFRVKFYTVPFQCLTLSCKHVGAIVIIEFKAKYSAMPLARDFLHPSPIEEKRKHKLKRLVQKPNSYFMDVKCPGCYAIKTIFSHAQRPVECDGCRTILCTPTGGKARLTEGCSFRRKVQC
ncbi:40S ribosomal protein S27 [Trachymyrmex cornetzi]|uniref:40S ribosomal protein S27 n=18 Tax=Formicidae TaxID=36668 RepID=A0A151J980_9HYME|nr:40S ribosomal protein S27 [Trachymyrmex cornetzi]